MFILISQITFFLDVPLYDAFSPMSLDQRQPMKSMTGVPQTTPRFSEWDSMGEVLSNLLDGPTDRIHCSLLTSNFFENVCRPVENL